MLDPQQIQAFDQLCRLNRGTSRVCTPHLPCAFKLVMGIFHVAKPDIGTGPEGSGFSLGFGLVLALGCGTLQGSHAGEFTGREAMGMPLALGLGLTSVHGVILCGFVTKLPSRHCSSHSPLEHHLLLCPCRPKESAAPSVPGIFLVPPACFGCGWWHFQFFLGLFFNYVTLKQPKDVWRVVQLRSDVLHGAL